MSADLIVVVVFTSWPTSLASVAASFVHGLRRRRRRRRRRERGRERERVREADRQAEEKTERDRDRERREFDLENFILPVL